MQSMAARADERADAFGAAELVRRNRARRAEVWKGRSTERLHRVHVEGHLALHALCMDLFKGLDDARFLINRLQSNEANATCAKLRMNIIEVDETVRGHVSPMNARSPFELESFGHAPQKKRAIGQTGQLVVGGLSL